MNNFAKYLLWTIVFIGFAAFYVGVVWAAIYSLKNTEIKNFPEVINHLISSIDGILAINLGAVLGFTITRNVEAFSRDKVQNPFLFFKDPNTSALQIIACYIYIFALVAAAIVWGIKSFKADAVVPALSYLTTSLIAVVIGAMGVVLARPKTN